MKHDLYKTGDLDTPECVKDRNGDVVLGLCRRCGRAEIELSEPCTRHHRRLYPALPAERPHTPNVGDHHLSH